MGTVQIPTDILKQISELLLPYLPAEYQTAETPVPETVVAAQPENPFDTHVTQLFQRFQRKPTPNETQLLDLAVMTNGDAFLVEAAVNQGVAKETADGKALYSPIGFVFSLLRRDVEGLRDEADALRAQHQQDSIIEETLRKTEARLKADGFIVPTTINGGDLV